MRAWLSRLFTIGWMTDGGVTVTDAERRADIATFCPWESGHPGHGGG